MEEEEKIEIPRGLAEQVVCVLKHDSKNGYVGNNTDYADIRHGSARAIAEELDVEWSEMPDAFDGHDLRDEVFNG